ncbi:MAG: DUF4112 domain-containing protein [Burkholderiales bacterium]|nr:DUF4112 domain-containing protein [Burkholderiales bacterium]
MPRCLPRRARSPSFSPGLSGDCDLHRGCAARIHHRHRRHRACSDRPARLENRARLDRSPAGETRTLKTAGDSPLPDAAAREKLERLSHWLDDRFAIPGTNWRIGLDGLIGLVPGIGDVVTTALSAYIVIEARRMGVPKAVLVRMIKNVVLDAAVGSVPLIGDVFDVRMKTNRRNLALLNDHFDSLREIEVARNAIKRKSRSAHSRRKKR